MTWDQTQMQSLCPVLQPHRSRLGLWRTGRERQVWLQMRAEAHATGTVNAVTYCSAVLCDRSAHLVPCPDKRAIALSCMQFAAGHHSSSLVMREGQLAILSPARGIVSQTFSHASSKRPSYPRDSAAILLASCIKRLPSLAMPRPSSTWA